MTDIMPFYDWCGGSAASSLYAKSTFIITTWSIANVSCATYFYKDSILQIESGANAGGSNHLMNAIIIGNSSASSALFKPASNAVSDDYIFKHGISNGTNGFNPNEKVVSDSQSLKCKSEIIVHGKYTDSNFSITIFIDLAASEFNSFPITNMDIIIDDNSVFSFNYISITFLLGTKLELKTNSTLIITGNRFIAFDKVSNGKSLLSPYFSDSNCCKNAIDAVFINNGILNVQNGSVGGSIETNIENAYIVGYSEITTIKGKASNNSVQTTSNYRLSGKKVQNESVVNDYLDDGSYISTSFLNDYCWDKINQVNKFYINYYDGTKLIHSQEISSMDSSYSFSSNSYTPTKDHYNFSDWMTSNNGNTSADGTIINSGSTLDVYAKWEEKEYKIDYTLLYNNFTPISSTNPGLSGYSSLIKKFKYSDFSNSSILLPIPTYIVDEKECTSDGWYIYFELMGTTYSVSIGTELSKNEFDALVSKTNDYNIDLSQYSIPLVCFYYNYDELIINYFSNYNNYENPDSQSGIGNFIEYTPNIPNYDDNVYNIQKYHSGWVNEELGLSFGINEKITITIINGIYCINSIPLGQGVNSVSIYASWENKNELTIDYNTELLTNDVRYFKEDSLINFTNIETSYTDNGIQYNLKMLTENLDNPIEFNLTNSRMPNSNLCLYAVWERPSKLILEKNNGEAQEIVYLLDGEEYILPTVNNNGYTLDGWYTSNTGGVKLGETFIMGNSDTTLFARWIPNNYSVTITTSNSTTTVSVNGTTVSNGGTIAYGSVVKVVLSYSQTDSLTFTVKAGQTDVTRYTDEACTKTTTSTTAGTYYFRMPANNITISSSSESGGFCLLPNTLVAMADGTFKEIQYIVPGEMVIVFNHETGMLDVAPVTFNEFEEKQWFNVVHLVFDNGSNIGVISEHGFFDLDTMRYEYIDETNYQNFIGHRFYRMDGSTTTLINAYVEEEYTMCYSFPTYYHLNFFTDDILSMPGGINGLFNIFEYGDNLQYDQDKMIEDINTYGLFTAEEFAQYGVTEEMFYAYGGQYLKVALGKGILTEEYLMYLIERYGKYTE